jgi:hypothetical protein
MENRDNQQETLKLSWLAGMIEGDGFLSVTVSKSKLARQGFNPKSVIGVVNQDMTLINEVDNIFRSLGVIAYTREYETPKGKPIAMISTSKMSGVKKVLDSIYPYLIGEKKARAEMILKFVNRRLGKKYSNLDEEDIELLREMNNKFVDHKGKLSDSIRLLRDCTLSGQKPVIQSDLTRDGKNSAEMSESVEC